MNVSKEIIRLELGRMGHTGISDEHLDLFKKDLDDLLQEEFKHPSFAFGDNSALSPSPIIIDNSNGRRASSTSNLDDHLDQTEKGRRIIKRKTIRYLNGKAYVSEESLASTTPVSYLNDNRSIDSSSDDSDLSDNYSLPAEPPLPKTNEKIGFLGQTRLPILSYGTKPCDPVLRYHQYKTYWDAYKTPGEKSHKELRWLIRGQMLDCNPTANVLGKRRNPQR